ncbi:RagB/SusD family nutrient uptake outer membrane protein [Alistipes sp.]|uniref:RagB/SusD family nutrient uptake outer membrane protein n=1 Tax=Alistipes sp. TaxID=1872444 RepID=UPI003AF03705
MKKIRAYALFLAIATLWSCEGWLDETPRNVVTKENFYKTLSDAEAAITGAYSAIGTDYFGITYYLLEELHGDYLTGRGTQAPISSFDMLLNQMSIDRCGQCWESFYKCINRSNTVLDNVTPMNIDPEAKKRILAEACFLRAMSYFNLVRAWGDVPLRLHEIADESSLAAPRVPVAQIYEQIEKDLAVAETDLPDEVGKNTGRASKWAAKMLYGQVLLAQERWKECAEKCDQIIRRGKYALVEVAQADDFYKLYNNETSSEDIFSMHHSTSRRAEITFYLHAPGTPPYNYSGSEGVYAWLPLTSGNSIIGDRWDDRDLRKSFNLYTRYQDENGEWVDNTVNPVLFKKFVTTPEGTSINTVPVYRYAEAFLMYAEAAAMDAGAPDALALERLNRIRRRAWGYPTASPCPVDYPAGMERDAFREAVLQERAYEFLLERRRWWDLKRTGKIKEAFEAIGKTYIDQRLLWPIPLAEIQNNPLIGYEDQNPGY